MKPYLIHAPLGLEAVAAAEGARVDPAGFCLTALLFGPLWLLAHRLWRVLAGYVALALAALALGVMGWLAPGAVGALFLLGHFYLGAQGRAFAAAARERRGLSLTEIVYARSALEAERTYYARKLPPLPARRAPFASPGAEVIGLFPESGR